MEADDDADANPKKSPTLCPVARIRSGGPTLLDGKGSRGECGCDRGTIAGLEGSKDCFCRALS